MEFGEKQENHYKPLFCGFCVQKIVMEIAKSARNHYKLVGRERDPRRFPPREIRSQKASEEATVKNLHSPQKNP